MRACPFIECDLRLEYGGSRYRLRSIPGPPGGQALSFEVPTLQAGFRLARLLFGNPLLFQLLAGVYRILGDLRLQIRVTREQQTLLVLGYSS